MFVNYIFQSNIYRTFDNLDEAEKLEHVLEKSGVVSLTLPWDMFLTFYMGLLGAYNTTYKA